MDKEKDSYKKVVIFISAIIVIFGVILGIIIINKKNTINIKDDDIAVEKGDNIFFGMGNIVNYFVSFNDKDILLDLLDKEYINENNITNENVIDYVKDGYTNVNFKVQNVEHIKLKTCNAYAVSGFLLENGMEDVNILDNDYKVLILLDYNNTTFSIYPNTTNAKEVLNNRKTFNIEKNKYNQIPASKIYTRYDLCQAYFNDFVFKSYYLSSDAYNLLDDDSKIIYKQEDLPNLFYGSASVKSCNYDDVENTYYIKSDNDKSLSIKVKSIMNYVVNID